MTNNIFDKEMATILKGMKIPYDAVSWKRLEKKLKENDGEDAIFDYMIADKLKAFSVPAGMHSFERLEAKMHRDSSNTGKLYARVGAVAAAILLLISGLFYFNGDSFLNDKNVSGSVFNNSPNSSKSKVEVVNFDAKSKENGSDRKYIDDQNYLKKTEFSHNTTESYPQEITKADELLSYNPSGSNSKLKYIGDFIMPSNINSGFNTNYGLTLAGQNNILNKQTNYFNSNRFNVVPDFIFTININFSEQLAMNNIPNTRDDYYLQEKQNSNGEKKLNLAKVKKNKDEFGNLDKDDIVYSEANNTISDEETKIIPEKGIVHNGLSAKVHVIPNTNLIDTPNDRILNIPGYSQVKNGLGAGVALSYKKNKHEIETGVDMMNLSYSPRKIVLENNNSSFYLDKIEFLKIRIPLVHKYHVAENKKWDFYSIAGVAANTMFKSNYSFVEKSIDTDGNEHILSHLAEELQDNFDFQNTLYSQKNYKIGVKDGAKLRDNLFVSANFGFGIKRKLNNGLSISFEPQYNFAFSGLGPNNDVVSSLEFKLGLSKEINL